MAQPPRSPIALPKRRHRAGLSLGAALSSALFLFACAPAAQMAGCKREAKTEGAPPPPPAELVPDAGLRGDSAVAENELWKAALADPTDPIELARLAEVEGASGLLVGLEEGGAVGMVALSALPYAEDAELATSRLAEIVPRLDAAALGPALDSLEGIVQRKRTQTEPLNPLGLHASFDALVELSKKKELPPETRARAVSVARLIAARGPYDARLLPTEFDR